LLLGVAVLFGSAVVVAYWPLFLLLGVLAAAGYVLSSAAVSLAVNTSWAAV
jgi:hypothetical protein